jgi:hypothetical protein
MMMRTIAIAGFVLALSAPDVVDAQTPSGQTQGEPRNIATRGTTEVTPGPQYAAGGLWQFLLGSNWRDLWTTPIQVPVLDVQRFAGGLTPFKKGGNQSHTLHFNGADGRRYVFRSVRKDIERILGDDLNNTFLGGVVQDQTSANHPSASTIADVLQNAAGVLHPWPQLVVMPDDPSLGEYREEFAGMLGHIEIKPDDVEEGVTPFAGASKIQGTDKMVQNLDESLEYRFDSRAYLKARLLDAIMGDFDRGADQWDWVRYDAGGLKTYRPIARDRDWAFMHANGLLVKRARSIYAKIGSYDEGNEKLKSVTFMTREFDRTRLSALPWSTWEAVVHELQTALTDDVIARAVAAQPRGFIDGSADFITAGFKARRDGLMELALKFYDMVNHHADVFAADGNELAEVERRDDGSVQVRITRYKKDGTLATDEGPAFDRAFIPSETEEVRIYMLEGNDRVVVRGGGPGDIKLRIVGGGGVDTLADYAAVSGQRTHMYDSGESTGFITTRNTAVHRGTFETQQPGLLEEPDEDDEVPAPPTVLEERPGRYQDQYHIPGNKFIDQKMQDRNQRYWGSTGTFAPTGDLRDGAGFILGAGYTHKSYGFRSQPFASVVSARAMYSFGASAFGVELSGDWRPPMSALALQMDVLASGFESQRFYGFGNDTELLPQEDALALRNELRVTPTLRWFASEHTSVFAGPVARFIDAKSGEDLPPIFGGFPGLDGSFGALGGRIGFEHGDPHQSILGRGFRLSGTASTFKTVDGGSGSFSRASGEAVAYIPLRWPTLALRVGGDKAWGEFPLHEAALLGGRTSLRGYRWNRFTGDASAFGNAELRVPVTRMDFLLRGDLGLILAGDAGRVWMDGESPGDWHTSYGAGLSFAALSNAVSVLYSRGEEDRVYLNFGLPF